MIRRWALARREFSRRWSPSEYFPEVKVSSRNLLIAAIVACFSPAIAQAQSLQFVEETIEVRICGSYSTLNGTYTFKNHGSSDAVWSIFYPLLNTKQIPFADSVCVFDTTSKRSIPFATSNEGISFPVTTPAEATSTYRIFYKQRTPARTMEYILTTTKEWGRPLERATFIITIPDSLQLTGISILYDRVEKSRNEHVYHIFKADFLPKNNLVINWRRRRP